MKSLRLLCAVVLVSVALGASARKKKTDKSDEFTPVYVFGIGLSFNDSIVYYTDIQLLDSAKVGKYDVLEMRSDYSNQFRAYIESRMHKADYSTMTVYELKRSKAEKDYRKFLKKYEKNSANMVLVEKEDFTYSKPENQQ